ncbi:hypothetical protein Tco_0805267, partial [Tanacetum coccineum]
MSARAVLIGLSASANVSLLAQDLGFDVHAFTHYGDERKRQLSRLLNKQQMKSFEGQISLIWNWKMVEIIEHQIFILQKRTRDETVVATAVGV